MSETTQYLMFFGLLWGGAIGSWLWIRWRFAKDAKAERESREAWALVTPRDGCTRSIPGCICARDNLGEWCVHRRTSSKPPNTEAQRAAEGGPTGAQS